uniref:BRCT domain-containing protein n=1 Tax=Heterorhabditis bacteriophora TaxID=37862 RepID=A0A1I7X8R8_HETBA
MMGEMCTERQLSFKCVHYTWLDECFEKRVGKCDATLVSHVGTAGYRVALTNCESKKKNYKPAEGTTQLIGSPSDDSPSPLQLISTLGYLQTQCTLSRSKNCSSDHVYNIISQCEEQMKPRAGYPQFDRHRLLR